MSLCSKAQNPDRIITVKNDTIPCTITLMADEYSYSYKKVEKDEPIKIETTNVKEFYSGDKKIWKRRVYQNGHLIPYFLTVIELGKISLFEDVTTLTSYGPFNTTSVSKTIEWYVAKGNDHADLLKSSKFKVFGEKKSKNAFVALIEDNKEVYNKFLVDNSFSFDEIKRIFIGPSCYLL